MNCKNCGIENEEDSKYCKKCGNILEKIDIEKKLDIIEKKITKSFFDTKNRTKEFSKEDIKENLALSILSYLSVLVLIPLFSRNNSQYLKFHVKQGINLLIIETMSFLTYKLLTSIFTTTHPVFLTETVPTLISFPFTVIGIILITMSTIGLYHVLNGEAKELPFIDKYKFIK